LDNTQRQQDVINAAIKIIANQGYQALTTKNLAHSVGISEAALYRHFESKTELIHKILEYFQDIAQEIMENIQKEVKDPLKKIKAFVMNRYKLFLQNPDLAKVMFSEEIYMNDRSLAEHNLNIMHIHRDSVIASIKAAQKQNQIRSDIDAVQLFRLIVGSMRLLVTQWQLCGNTFNLQKEGEKLWNVINKMIIKEKP